MTREHVGNPRRIIHVTFATRHAADLEGIGKNQLEMALEHMPNRLPVHARRFHGDMGALVRCEPVGQRQQIGSRRAERAHLLLDVDPDAMRAQATTVS